MINNLSRIVGYTVNYPREVILQGFTSGANSSTTGTIIKATDVYSVSEGTVLSVEHDIKDLYVVTVQYTPTQLFRYCCLTSVSVKANDYIIPSDKIGKTNKGLFRFEYCTTEMSLHVVRTNSTTYYKQDPSGVLLDIVQLYMSENAIGKFLTKSKVKKVEDTKPLSHKNNLSDILPGGNYA